MRNLKKALALVLAMAMSLSLAVTAGAAYTDGAQISDDYATAVEFASQTGILEGFEDGSYGPQKNLTRAQLATMTYRIATGDVEDVYTADFAGGAAAAFTDTAATAWYAGYVGYAADAGYLKGCGEGLYKPNSALTGYQALAAFLRVVGYNQPGQFTGADWTVQVAQVAYETGALEGITGVDLNAAISREVAAQIIFNILFADKVGYTPAFGYQNALGEEDLAEDVFGIVAYKADAATAPWGQPAQEWYVKDGRAYEAVVSIPYAPVAEYTVAVSECDLSKDLGLTENFGDDRGEKIVEYKNGARDGVVDGAIVLTDTTTKIGAQGTLTEVYEVEGDYWFVQIETFLGQITKTYDAKVDTNGHEIEAAKADLDVFCNDKYFNKTLDTQVKTDAFAKEDYVLVNVSFYDMKDVEYFLTETAPVATSAELTYKTDVNDYSVIGGETYNWAAHYEYDVKPGYVNTKYDVFVDFYGNLIGLFEPAPADPVYAVLDRGIKATTGFSSKVEGDLVSLDGNVNEITIASYDKFNGWNETEKDIHDIVAYEVNEDGKYEMTKVDSTEHDRYIIKKGESNIAVYDFVKHGRDWDTKYTNVLADENTIFVVETKHADGEKQAEYDVYVGYKAVPSMVATAQIEVFEDKDDGNSYADIIYVDATAATVLNGTALAYVDADYEGTGALDNDVRYNVFSGVVINGEAVEVMANDDVEASLNLLPAGMYTLYYDENGLVEKAVAEVGYSSEVTVDGVYGDGFTIGRTNYEVDANTVIWVIDGDDAKVGTLDDIEEDAKIIFKADSNTTAEYVIVFAD